MLAVLLLIIQLLAIDSVNAWYTGPDGKIATEGTPGYAANRYIQLIFKKYGVDMDERDEMGRKILKELMESLGLGVIHKIPIRDMGPENEEAHHADDRHRRAATKVEQMMFPDSVWWLPHEHENISEAVELNMTDCLSASLLLQEYKIEDSVTEDAGIDSDEFGMLCPAILYLANEKSCISTSEENKHHPKVKQAYVWIFGIASITLISVLSLLGVVVVPLIGRENFQTILSVLVSGAVGAMCGDAILHLIPHSQPASHSHSQQSIYKNLMVLVGIYVLFLIEGVMKLVEHKKKQKKKNQTMNGNSGKELLGDSKDDPANEAMVISTHQDEVKNEKFDIEIHDTEHGHSHHHDHVDFKDKGIASMAWMVIVGDGMHNFSDGVAIGAAYSAGTTTGVSTSLAVFCHELPHELGDFAMLIKSGMTVKQALLYNALAACLGYLGLMVGILIGNYAADFVSWIFALTAGMFIYVGLVDMMPEINSGFGNQKIKKAIKTFILQNISLLTGVGIMFLISVYEEEISI